MAYQKQVWEDLPSTNTPITADRLNHIENGIADVETGLTPVTSYTETNDKSYACNYVNDVVEDLEDSIQEIYSTDEVLTNKIWIDSKPIYRKVIYVSAFPNATEIAISVLDLNIDFVVNFYGFAKKQNGSGFPINDARPIAGVQNSIGAWLDNNEIKIAAGTNRSDFSGYITLEYTKTTD